MLSSAKRQCASLTDNVFNIFDRVSRKVSLQVTTSEKFRESAFLNGAKTVLSDVIESHTL